MAYMNTGRIQVSEPFKESMQIMALKLELFNESQTPVQNVHHSVIYKSQIQANWKKPDIHKGTYCIPFI